MRRNDTPASKGQSTTIRLAAMPYDLSKKTTSYIVMIIEARNIIFRIFLWHVLKIVGFICIPRRTNILSPFANPVYLVQFIRLQGSRLNFFKVLSPINVWRTFEFRDYRNKKNLLKIYRCTCDIMMKRNYWGWWYMYIVINNYPLKSKSVYISSTLIRTCLAETQKVIQVVRSFPTGP